MVVFSLFVVWCFSFCCVSVSFFFFSTPTSRLAPTARTLLGGLEHTLFIFFVVAARLFFVFASILLHCCWRAHKSLAPRTRTLLGVLAHATLHFVAVATVFFFSFCVCPKICDLAKQRRKVFVGVSGVGKFDLALYFFWLCVFFLVFLFLLLRSRDTGFYHFHTKRLAFRCHPPVTPPTVGAAHQRRTLNHTYTQNLQQHQRTTHQRHHPPPEDDDQHQQESQPIAPKTTRRPPTPGPTPTSSAYADPPSVSPTPGKTQTSMN